MVKTIIKPPKCHRDTAIIRMHNSVCTVCRKRDVKQHDPEKRRCDGKKGMNEIVDRGLYFERAPNNRIKQVNVECGGCVKICFNICFRLTQYNNTRKTMQISSSSNQTVKLSAMLYNTTS
jgi:hypothetical protein